MATKKADPEALEEMPTEVDFRGGVRGKYFHAFHAMRRTVVLEPDVASWFPTDEAVNEALRSLIESGPVDPEAST